MADNNPEVLADELTACERALARRTEERNHFAALLQQAAADLRTVGDDYPGSSCHKWCHERADAALGLPAPAICEDCRGRGYQPANPARGLYSECPTCNGTGHSLRPISVEEIQRECTACDGTGTVEHPFLSSASSIMAENPPDPVIVECEDCEGTGRVWEERPPALSPTTPTEEPQS